MSNYTNVTFGNDKDSSWTKMLENIPSSSRVLDVGCSSGSLGAHLIENKQCEVIGIDLDKDDVSIAKKALTDAYVMNIETDSIDRLGKFDRVIFADVLEHLVDPSGVLEKIKKVLKPKGKVLFSIPNMAHMATRLMLLQGKFSYGETGLLDKTHLHFYDEAEVQRIFVEAGYYIDHLDWTEYYIPSQTLNKELSKIGLIPNEAFLNDARKIDAVALQYVGTALPGKIGKVKIKLPAMSPWTEKTEVYVDEIKQEYENEIAKLRNDHHNITNSKSWKITKPLRLANRVRKTK